MSSDSWTILSPIEQKIKRKIESVGVPLKDWDISINYGIKTGFNDAFIISKEKRNEILANCKTDKERQETAKIIRPILRGRDIKRYECKFADLYLINTHNGVKENGKVKIPRIDIKDYPAVKKHLDKYWYKISIRADKGDTPYNLRNCAYMDEFDKPKIIFQEIVQESQFMIDLEEKFMCNDTCRIITGSSIKYLTGILNSKLFFFAVKRFYGGGGLGESGVRMKHTFFEKFCCASEDKDITILVDSISQNNQTVIESQIDHKVYELYGLTKEEVDFIEQQR